MSSDEIKFRKELIASLENIGSKLELIAGILEDRL